MPKENKSDDLNISRGQKARFTKLFNEIETEGKSTLNDLTKIKKDLTVGTPEEPGLLKRLQQIESNAIHYSKKAEEKFSSIDNIFKKINETNPVRGTSMQDELEEFLSEFEDRLTEITSLRNQFASFRKDLEGFMDEDGEKVKGIKDDILDYKREFKENLKKQATEHDEFVKNYEARFTQLKDKIESLLPGASTIGIAKAFESHKKSFDKPILIWSGVFLASLLGMILYVLFNPPELDLSIEKVGIRILNNLPFFLPIIWIAIYASKQQSQNKRLQQEYAFKEDVAMSYQGFKKEIENLDESSESQILKIQFMKRLVNIIGENPTSTLENSDHKEKPPILEELADKLNFSDSEKD